MKNEFKKLGWKNELGYRHRKFKKRQNVEILGYRVLNELRITKRRKKKTEGYGRRNQNYGMQKKENRNTAK